VSMNMWGLTPEFFAILKNGFEQFLNKTDMEDLKAEYLLPTIIGELLKEGTVSVKVLKSEDQWFGVTYKEDRETVVEAVKSLIDKGIYPDKL
ncbi:MAG: nucleotidyltransferase, partial [[Ruminococcus] torques]